MKPSEGGTQSVPKRKKHVIYWILGLVFVVGILSSCPAADFLVRSALLHPTKIDPKWKPTFPDCEEAWFPMKTSTSSIASPQLSSSTKGKSPKKEVPFTKGKDALHGLYFPYKATPTEPSRGVILFSHGNGGTVQEWGNVGALLREKLHVSVLIYDYRGYGKSAGKPTASTVLSDGRAARKWLAEREKISEEDIIQMGRSLGGAVAIDLAAKDGAKALIVESTFASLPDMVKRFVPGVPAKILLLQQLSSIKKIAKYDGPFFYSHGTEDTLIPFEQGQQLFNAAASKDKTFYKVEGGGHNTHPPSEYYETKLVEFLDRVNQRGNVSQK